MPTPTTDIDIDIDIDIDAVARGLRGMLDTFGQEPIARRDRTAVHRLQGAYVCAAMLAGLDPHTGEPVTLDSKKVCLT